MDIVFKLPRTTSPLSDDKFQFAIPYRDFGWVRRVIYLLFIFVVTFGIIIDETISRIVYLVIVGIFTIALASDAILVLEKYKDKWVIHQYYGSLFHLKLRTIEIKLSKVQYKILGKKKTSPVRIEFYESNIQRLEIKTTNYYAKELQEALQVHGIEVSIKKAPYLN